MKILKRLKTTYDSRGATLRKKGVHNSRVLLMLKRTFNTIYSNIQNLSTSEIWLYYGLDYKKPCKTSTNELLALGDTSIYSIKAYRFH